jgi:hypothetical protein
VQFIGWKVPGNFYLIFPYAFYLNLKSNVAQQTVEGDNFIIYGYIPCAPETKTFCFKAYQDISNTISNDNNISLINTNISYSFSVNHVSVGPLSNISISLIGMPTNCLMALSCSSFSHIGQRFLSYNVPNGLPIVQKADLFKDLHISENLELAKAGLKGLSGIYCFRHTASVKYISVKR